MGFGWWIFFSAVYCALLLLYTHGGWVGGLIGTSTTHVADHSENPRQASYRKTSINSCPAYTLTCLRVEAQRWCKQNGYDDLSQLLLRYIFNSLVFLLSAVAVGVWHHVRTMDALQTCVYVIPWSIYSRLVQKTFYEEINKTLRKHFIIIAFSRPVVGGGTFSRLLVAPIIDGSLKKTWLCHPLLLLLLMRVTHTIFLVFWWRGWYELAEIPPSQIPLAQSTHFGIIFSPMSCKFLRGRHGHIFLQDLGLALVTNTCPHRTQAIK